MSLQKTLSLIEKSSNEKSLRNWIANARRLNEAEIEKAALRRLIEILPQEEFGSLEWDFWRTIYAFEHVLTDERGRTTRLSRTRQKIARDGVEATLKQWALDKAVTQGFIMLMERNMPDLLGEAIILRHPARFEKNVQAAARARLIGAGVDLGELTT